MTKYVFVTGGVVSGLGKGITAASLGRLLKARGLKVAAQKLDPYINVDPGTMSPYQHGEVYVTEDGAEADLDLGHYERFIDEDLNRYSNLTTGKVYWNVLNRERRGEYLGQTIQVIPHITGEIKDFIYKVGKNTGADVVITEIGGTTGDIESQPFLEAARQVSLEQGPGNCLFIHVTLVPFIKGSDEHKTKPTQHSVRELQAMGISPNIIVLRCDEPLEPEIFKKIAMFCNVKPDCVIENMTLPNLYEAPLMLEKSDFSLIVCRELGLWTRAPELSQWKALVERIKSADRHVTIGLVGKYVQLHDAYLSVAEALHHAGYACGATVDIKWIDSETVTDENAAEVFSGCDGMIVPGGFGDRGIGGMISAARYARETGIKEISKNRKAFHEYFVLERFEAGIELAGTEVKSIRAGQVNLKDSFCTIKDGELFVRGMHISPYEHGNIFNKDPVRPRRLLMHKREILKLQARVMQDGVALIPLSLYFKDSRVKVELGLCKGKKLHDKRDSEADRESKRDIDRAMKERNYS